VTYEVFLARKAEEDLKELIKQGYGKKIKELIRILEKDPFQNPLRYKLLTGEMKGMFSRRINIEHRLVYEVLSFENEEFKGTVKVHRIRTHYKGIIPLFFFLTG
jgi:Txe/YoeB family toxin of toxin-antitoxin system